MKIASEHETRGRVGEDRYRNELLRLRDEGVIFDFFRPEWIVFPKGREPFLVEVKDQDLFTAPPFDGHGITERQAINYGRFRAATGLKTLLVVYDNGSRYDAWLHELEGRGDAFVHTTGRVRRRVYEITGFRRRGKEVRAA